MVKIINLPDAVEYDLSNREAYLQWKSDCWRNVSIALKDAVENIGSGSIQLAIDMFNDVEKMFPFQEV
jgi:hypothetical protein